MKTPTMSEKKEIDKNLYEYEAQGQKDERKSRSQKIRCVLIAAIVCTFICTIAILGFAAFLIVDRFSFEKTKSYQAKYMTGSGEIMEELVSISKSEEKYEIPGQVGVVLDFDKELAVFRMIEDGRYTCFLTTLNTTAVISPESLTKLLESQTQPLKAEKEMYLRYRATNTGVNKRNFLSPMSQAMCADTKIMWMVQTEVLYSVQPEFRVRRRVQEKTTTEVSVLWGLFKIKVTRER